MKRIVLQIVYLALIVYTCRAAIILPTPNQQRIDSVYGATIDVLTVCAMGTNNAIGIVGDADGFVKALWLKHAIPVVLIDATMKDDPIMTDLRARKLYFFVIVAVTPELFDALMNKLARSVWWNHEAKFLILSPTPDEPPQLLDLAKTLHIAYNNFGVLDAQLVLPYRDNNVFMIIDYNPFTMKAPEPWKLLETYDGFHLFIKLYRKEEKSCEALSFPKTTDIGGYPFEFMLQSDWVFCKLTKMCDESFAADDVRSVRQLDEIMINQYQWFVDNIASALNASVIIKKHRGKMDWDISIVPTLYADMARLGTTAVLIHSFDETPLFAMTQHTAHMSQLEKILSVIDETSRIGMYVVYLITFIFFKFFMRQAVMPAILNLVRLTCNTGLPKLPTNVAPTVYLACLFMFVITLQAIYTGNLASLLTTTIAYPNVNAIRDVPKLGYTVYAYEYVYNKIAADPILNGRVVEIPFYYPCQRYVLSDPLAACIAMEYELINVAILHNLHMSRDPIQRDYSCYFMPENNPLKRRVQGIITTWHECGLRRSDKDYETFRSALVDDDEVKKNTFRRVMNFGDLRFAFVILGVGLTFSFVCFIVEILIPHIRRTLAKRRNRVRPLLPLNVSKKNYSWFSALKLNFNVLRLVKNRR